MKKKPTVYRVAGKKLTDRRSELMNLVARANAGDIDSRQELERIAFYDPRTMKLVQELQSAELARQSARSSAVRKRQIDHSSAKQSPKSTKSKAKTKAKARSQAGKSERKPLSPWSRLMEKATGWVRFASGGLPTLGKRR